MVSHIEQQRCTSATTLKLGARALPSNSGGQLYPEPGMPKFASQPVESNARSLILTPSQMQETALFPRRTHGDEPRIT